MTLTVPAMTLASSGTVFHMFLNLFTGLVALACIALGASRSSGNGGWLGDRVPLPSREQATAALHMCFHEVSMPPRLYHTAALILTALDMQCEGLL